MTGVSHNTKRLIGILIAAVLVGVQWHFITSFL
jgi:hypothetical protein